MNNQDILFFYRMLRHEKETELRAIIPKKEIKTFHFSTEEELIKLCKEMNGKYNLYLGINERVKGGTSKKDIEKVKVIPLDIDCINKPATDKDMKEAMDITIKIIEDGKEQGFQEPSVSYSGNGYQIFFCIPEIKITNENRDKIEEKIQEFQKRMIDKYSTDNIKLDNVGDLPRIMRITGTYNLKSKTTSKSIISKINEDEKLKEHILELELSKSVVVGGLDNELKEKIKEDEKIQGLFNANIKDIKKFKSRSEAELSLVCRLVQIGLNKEQIFRIMASCKIGKWQEANIKYRELTYKKAIEIISKERLSSCKNPSLNDLYLIYKKWLYIEDTKRIDIILATYLTKFLEGTPIWLILVGCSGDGKTEQLMALKKCEGFHIENNFTSRTLISGNPKVKDLAPDLNNKFLAIPDMAQILKLPPTEKGVLWGQLRDLYDGFAGKSFGSGKRSKYENLRVTFVACSTPSIDGQILVHQDLGTRELVYRTEEIENKQNLMDYAINNEKNERKMKEELRNITYNFLFEKRVIQRKLDEIELREIKNIAMFISKVRATAEIDSYTNELRNLVYPENPTRVVKQLKRLYLALMSLEKDYKQKKAFEILWRLAKSCAFPIRIRVFEFFIRDYLIKKGIFEFSTSNIANNLMIGKRTSQRELQVLWNLGFVSKREVNEENRWKPTDYWKLNLENLFIINYLKYIRGGRL